MELDGVSYVVLESRWRGDDYMVKLRADDGRIVYKKFTNVRLTAVGFTFGD
jgi:hypothetical protein